MGKGRGAAEGRTGSSVCLLGKNVPDDRFDEQGDTLGEDKFMANKA